MCFDLYTRQSVCLCVFLASDSWETIRVIIVNLGTVIASDMRLYRVLIVLTLTFIQGLTDRNHENNMFYYFKYHSNNAHHVCCEDSPAKGLYDRCQPDDPALHLRSHVHLKRDYFLTCTISDNMYAITFKLGMTVDLWMS